MFSLNWMQLQSANCEPDINMAVIFWPTFSSYIGNLVNMYNLHKLFNQKINNDYFWANLFNFLISNNLFFFLTPLPVLQHNSDWVCLVGTPLWVVHSSLPRRTMTTPWEGAGRCGSASIRASVPPTGKWCSTLMVSFTLTTPFCSAWMNTNLYKNYIFFPFY